MYRVVLVVLGGLLLSACAFLLPAPITPTSIHNVSNATSPPSPTSSLAVGAASATPISEYADRWLCFAVKVPSGWKTDGVPGGYAWFKSGSGQDLGISNVSTPSGPPENLQDFLANVKRGPLGSHIYEVGDFIVGNHPALWITFTAETDTRFAVLVITPDCSDGKHALVISARGTDRETFVMFLKQIRFLRE